MVNAIGFSGHALNSPALCSNRISAPSTSIGVLYSVTPSPNRSVASSSRNSTVSRKGTLDIPVEEPVFSCSTVPFSCNGFGAMPISWLKILRISRASKPLSRARGQVCAQRRHKLQRYADSPRRATVCQFSSISPPINFTIMPFLPPGISLPFLSKYFFTIIRNTSARKVGRYSS